MFLKFASTELIRRPLRDFSRSIKADRGSGLLGINSWADERPTNAPFEMEAPAIVVPSFRNERLEIWLD